MAAPYWRSPYNLTVGQVTLLAPRKHPYHGGKRPGAGRKPKAEKQLAKIDKALVRQRVALLAGLDVLGENFVGITKQLVEAAKTDLPTARFLFDRFLQFAKLDEQDEKSPFILILNKVVQRLKDDTISIPSIEGTLVEVSGRGDLGETGDKTQSSTGDRVSTSRED